MDSVEQSATAAPEPEPAAVAAGGSRAALAGVLFGVIYVAAFIVFGRAPNSDATVEAFERFYSSSTERTVVTVAGLYFVPIAGIMLLWFTAAVRHRVASLAGREDALLSTVQLISAAVYVALLFAAAAVLTTPAIAVETGALTVEELVEIRPLLVVGDTILVVFALRSAAVFVAAGTTRAMRSGLIPKWLAYVSYAMVLVLVLTVARARFVTLLFPTWVVMMSLIVWRRRIVARHDLANTAA